MSTLSIGILIALWALYRMGPTVRSSTSGKSKRVIVDLGLVLAVSLAVSTNADAGCVCRCVNGEVRALCQSSIDLQPICPPTVCPIVPPRVEPITPPTVPPLGTSGCRNVQVLNPNSGQYEWRRVCQ